MSRIPKLKIEKTKVKVVFRLQFHATHIPQPGWDKLFVSFSPTDSGKAIAKTTKASVRNGSCKWSDPIYETTRLLQDPKTKDFDEKLYKLVVAMGSSRSSLLGEVIINLADFVDALKPSSAALPLHGCDFGTILHVTVQLLTSKTGFREFEQQRELSVKGFQASSGKRIHDNEAIPAPAGTSEHIDKVNARGRFKGDCTGLPPLEEVGELDEEYEDSAAGVDGSSYTSESLYVEKNDFSGLAELDGLKSRASGDAVEFTPVHSSSTGKGENNYKQLSSQLGNHWSHGWSSDYSIDNDLPSTFEDSATLNARVQVAESAILQLKSEAKSLQNISDELSSETQHLAQQLAMELSSGEKLAGEFNILKSEYWKFKNDLDVLKATSASQHSSRRKTPSAVQVKCFPEEASFESTLDAGHNNQPSDFQSKLLQGIFLIECKAQQIQNKACLAYDGNVFDYIYSEFSVLGSLIQNLKQSITQELSVEHVSGRQTRKNQYSSVSPSQQHVHGQDDVTCFADILYSEGIKEKKMVELSEQLDISNTENRSLAGRMTQMECYYEALIHELEERQKQTSDQLENLKAEHASCFYTISDLQNQNEKLLEELNGQLIRFAEDRRNLESFIKELEKRAISSETMLKRVRWNYAIAVDRLQKDLELLSFQVLSMYEANQSLAKQALADATEQHRDNYSEEMQLWHRGEWLAASNQKQQKLALAEIQHDISLANGDQELSAIINGVSENSNHRMLNNFSSKEENKGASQTGLSMEFHVNEEPNASANALKLHDIPSAASIHDFMQDRKDPSLSHNSLMEKLRSGCLYNLNVEKPIDYSQISDNAEYMKDVYHYPPPEKQRFDYRAGSKEIEMSLDMLKQLHATSGGELSEVVMLYMHWEVYAQVLQETFREVFPGIGHMNVKLVELQEKIKHCTNDNEFLILEMQAALDESRILREAEEKCISRYNELVSKNHIMEVKLNDVLYENSFLVQKVADCQSLIADFGVSESKYKACAAENIELKNMLKEENTQRDYLQSKVSSLTEEFKSLKEQYEIKCSLNSDLQRGATNIQDKLRDLCNCVIFCSQQICDSIFDDVFVKEELDSENYDAIISHLQQFQHKVSCRLFSIQQEKKVAEEQREIDQRTLNERESHISYMKQKFDSELEEVRTKLEHSRTKVQDLEIELQEAVKKLKLSKEAEEGHILENRKLLSNMSILEVELQLATDECRDFSKKLLATEGVVNEELANTKLRLTDLMQENRDLLFSIQSCNEASVKLEYEISSLKDSLHYAEDKLQSERKIRDDLEVSVADLKLQVVETSQQLLSFNEQNDELCYLRTRVLDLERDVQHVELCKERERERDAETSFIKFEVANMENHLITAFGHSISADVELTFIRNQLYSKIEEFVVHQKTSKSIIEQLHLKYLDVIASLEKYVASEAELMAERERLSTDLLSAKSTLEVLHGEKERLLAYVDANTINRAEFEDLKMKAAISEANYAKEKRKYEDEICSLKSMLLRLEELDELELSKVELDLIVVFLRSKLSEQKTHAALFEECDYELRKLREQHSELNRKLSEQILKTEEFKNLSIHLRELKDKADAESHHARERRESEGSSLVGQESLRIAFIKEQYESKIHELKNQCFVSRKYAEEMLMKLQNSLDDNEKRKKSEASLAKRNEEISVLLSDLEAELQTVVADRRELIKAYDRMKAELECTILSLECCKEEKLRLQNSLKETCDEREKIRVELDLVKRLLENMASTTGTRPERNYEAHKPDATLIGELLDDCRLGISVMYDDPSSACGICSEDQAAKKNLLKEPVAERSTLLENNATQIAHFKEHFREQQKLMTGMELLHKQLQSLRNENLSSDLGFEEDHSDADLQDLHRELAQLEMANEQLGSIFPSYKKLTSYGNALERVLALELELAEALQVKKSGSHIQSSFLKQHNDDEAIFQSFKDINELIKDMIELKKRNAAIETQLQEMHGRYSQLSLQFAEVEGERQKLVMSLKNRTPKKSQS
ncbi:early endosome antigen 1 isoform X1 [Dendrobium catenatum]|uniref:early endosome antigen 1 isoform X1 n=2 Tax=Dendrobium catenatum TaxID=906689 RepID=UPI0009F73372|nr:early endosome antigen 1 isoform X1 [Dendrobium catenatum]XP_020696393.1 early endosome antigen 1 isoform X1 [Dendrobium catenatum]